VEVDPPLGSFKPGALAEWLLSGLQAFEERAARAAFFAI
jgi:hypothetical protein